MNDENPSCVTGMHPVPTNFVYGYRLTHLLLNRKQSPQSGMLWLAWPPMVCIAVSISATAKLVPSQHVWAASAPNESSCFRAM